MNRILVYGLSQNILGGIETFLLNMNSFMSDDTIFDYIIEGSHTIHNEVIAKKGGKCFFITGKKDAFANIRDWKQLLSTKKKDYSIIYFNLYSLAWIFPITIALRKGYKVIVHAHNNKLHDCGLLQKLLHFINKQLCKHLKIVRFSNSELSSKFFFGRKESMIINNAIDIDLFGFKKEKRDAIRKLYSINNDNNLYGFSGRLAYSKNPLFLIDIFNEIYKIDNHAKFIICGDGNLKDQMLNKAKDYSLDIIFTGNVNNISDYYCAMDCFILPSRSEGLGLVLIEAQASGLNCYTSKDVVPSAAKVTELLDYIPLTYGATEWANIIKNSLVISSNRAKYADQVAKTDFNILKEAKRLEQEIMRN